MSGTDVKFTETHEWIRVEGDVATLGLSDYAQKELGDIVFVELPEAGTSVSVGDVLSTVESVKSVSEIYSPLAGEVVDTNGDLEGEPALVNSDPYGKGWILKLKLSDKGPIDGLMSEEQYKAHTEG
jgi:glycine cleavage system H protein